MNLEDVTFLCLFSLSRIKEFNMVDPGPGFGSWFRVDLLPKGFLVELVFFCLVIIIPLQILVRKLVKYSFPFLPLSFSLFCLSENTISLLFDFDSLLLLGCAPVMLPAKTVNAMNLNIEGIHVNAQPRFSNVFVNDFGKRVI